jgi:hypothetical protein
MASEQLQKQGTAINWLNTGGDHALTLTSLANNNGRKGVVHDFGATIPRRCRWIYKTDHNVAPTAGLVQEIYWSSSSDNTDFDGTLSSADAAMNDTNTLNKLYYVGTLYCENNTTSQIASGVFELPARYGFPVIFNRSGQALSGTASDHRFQLVPLIDEAQ